MKYFMHLNPRPFNAIKAKTKKIEGRSPHDENERLSEYEKMQPGDTILFENNQTHQILNTKIKFIHHYQNVREMLKKEGVENVLSSKGTIEEGIESYNSLGDYKERIKKFGIYAIGIEPIEV